MGRVLSLATLGVLAVACAGSSSETSTRGTDGTAVSGSGGSAAVGMSSGGSRAVPNPSGSAGMAPDDTPPPVCEEYYTCCNRDDGTIAESDCGDDGFHLRCAGNSFHQTTEHLCKPDSVDASDCSELDGVTCEPGQQCHNYVACSWHCTCVVMGAGYRFQCGAYAC